MSNSDKPQVVVPAAKPSKSEIEAAQRAEYARLKTTYGSFSAGVRHELAAGKTRGELAKSTGVRYQHIRNIDVTPVKKK